MISFRQQPGIITLSIEQMTSLPVILDNELNVWQYQIIDSFILNYRSGFLTAQIDIHNLVRLCDVWWELIKIVMMTLYTVRWLFYRDIRIARNHISVIFSCFMDRSRKASLEKSRNKMVNESNWTTLMLEQYLIPTFARVDCLSRSWYWIQPSLFSSDVGNIVHTRFCRFVFIRIHLSQNMRG